jgi:hypothetical protein
VEGLPKQVARRLLHGTQILGHKAVKAADHVGQAALHQGEPLLQGAFNQGKKLFKGAVDYSNDRQIQTAIAAGLISPVAHQKALKSD